MRLLCVDPLGTYLPITLRSVPSPSVNSTDITVALSEMPMAVSEHILEVGTCDLVSRLDKIW